MSEFIVNNWDTILTTLFGGGGFLAYFSERKKRTIDNKKNEINAFQEMQVAYDKYVSDSNTRFDQLRSLIEEQNKELEELRPLKVKVETVYKELHTFKMLYENEKQKNALCKKCKGEM